jgi:hypothetical protein
VNGVDKIPIAWEFYMLWDGAQGWMAAGYVSNFIGYFFVSVLEMVAWIIFQVNQDGYMLNLLSDWFYYCFLLYALPWIFPILHLMLPLTSGGLANPTILVPFQSNDIFLIIMGLIMWLYIGIIHLIYTQPMKEHLLAVATNCKCEPWKPKEGDDLSDKNREYMERLAQEECRARCPSEAELARLEAEKQRNADLD